MSPANRPCREECFSGRGDELGSSLFRPVACLPFMSYSSFFANDRSALRRQQSPTTYFDLRLLAATNRSTWTAPRPGIGSGALSSRRHAATMAQTPVATDVHQTLDVHRDFPAQIALDPHLLVDNLTNAVDLVVGQVPYSSIWVDIRALEKPLAGVQPNSEDVRQCRLD